MVCLLIDFFLKSKGRFFSFVELLVHSSITHICIEQLENDGQRGQYYYDCLHFLKILSWCSV